MSISRGRRDRLRSLIESMRLWWGDAPKGAWLLTVAAEAGVSPRVLVHAAACCAEAALGFEGTREPLDFDALRASSAWASRSVSLSEAERAAGVAIATRKRREPADRAARLVASLIQAVRLGSEVEKGRVSGAKLARALEAVFRHIAVTERALPVLSSSIEVDPCHELWRVRIALLWDKIPREQRADAAVAAGAGTIGALVKYLDPACEGPSHAAVAARAVRAIDAAQRVAEVATASAFYVSFGPDELVDSANTAAARIRSLKAAAEVAHTSDLAFMVRDRLMARVRSRRAAANAPVDLVEASLISALAALNSAEALMFGARAGDPLAAAIDRQCASIVRKHVPFATVYQMLTGGREAGETIEGRRKAGG